MKKLNFLAILAAVSIGGCSDGNEKTTPNLPLPDVRPLSVGEAHHQALDMALGLINQSYTTRALPVPPGSIDFRDLITSLIDPSLPPEYTKEMLKCVIDINDAGTYYKDFQSIPSVEFNEM